MFTSTKTLFQKWCNPKQCLILPWVYHLHIFFKRQSLTTFLVWFPQLWKCGLIQRDCMNEGTPSLASSLWIKLEALHFCVVLHLKKLDQEQSGRWSTFSLLVAVRSRCACGGLEGGSGSLGVKGIFELAISHPRNLLMMEPTSPCLQEWWATPALHPVGSRFFPRRIWIASAKIQKQRIKDSCFGAMIYSISRSVVWQL